MSSGFAPRSPCAPRPGRGAGLSVVLALGAAILAATPEVQAQPAGARNYAFSFADAEIASVANEVLGATLKIPFVVDPAVTGRVTLRIERRMAPEQLLEAFEAALSLQGVAMVREGGQILIVPKGRARQAGGVRPDGGATRPGYEQVSVTLQYAPPSDVAKVLSAIGPADVVVHADDRMGVIVLAGSSADIRAARETIALFDRSSLADARVRVVSLRASAATALGADLSRLLAAAGVSGVQIVPLHQLNALVLFGRSPAVLDEAETWIARLDQPSNEEETTLWVYRPRNLSAESLAEAIRSLSQSRGSLAASAFEGFRPAMEQSDGAVTPVEANLATPPATALAGGFTDPEGLKVSVEKSTNSLLVMAPASRWRALQQALDELDRPPDQVMIEATILEVTLGREFEYGVDWSFLALEDRLTIAHSQSQTGGVQSVFPGFSATFLDVGVSAAVNAIATRTNVEVMSAPKLLALNNQTASLQVGDEVPIVIQRAQSTSSPGAPLVSTTEYRDTGVILKVKPRINGPDTVLLELSQEVSGVRRTTTSGIDSPTIQQRKFESSLQVREGQTIALGGLISTARGRDDAGVPLLKDIPLAGALFKTERGIRQRTELVVLLGAKILRTPEGEDSVTDDLRRSLGEIERRGLGSK